MFTRALANQSLPSSLDREKLLALDRISSVGLFMIGIMALAEACGVAVQSIMTVGGIGGKDWLHIHFPVFVVHDVYKCLQIRFFGRFFFWTSCKLDFEFSFFLLHILL